MPVRRGQGNGIAHRVGGALGGLGTLGGMYMMNRGALGGAGVQGGVPGHYDLNTGKWVDATSAPVTCQLPKASDWRDRVLRIKKTDSSVNAVTITPAGSETIDGGASASISAQNVCLQAMSDGAAWYLVGEYVP